MGPLLTVSGFAFPPVSLRLGWVEVWFRDWVARGGLRTPPPAGGRGGDEVDGQEGCLAQPEEETPAVNFVKMD